jgi:hypothetical protein
MAQTTSVTVATHIMSEILSELALEPLTSKIVVLPKINQSSIAGMPSKVRKIPKKNRIAAAVDDVEGAAFATPETMTYQSAISLTPTTKVQGTTITMDAVLLAMPGMNRDQAIAAIENGSPEAIPFLRNAVSLILEAHRRRAETDALALFSSLSESAGSTNVTLSFATLLTALFNVLDNNPEHEELFFALEEKGVNDLKTLLIAGSGSSLSSVWSNPNADVSLFKHYPDVNRSGFRGSILDIPLIAADKAIMATANSNVDRVGALLCLGRGATATPGSLRGAHEFCEGYAPSLGFEFNLTTDDVDVIGRWKWAVAEHTDEHGCQIIYKKD